MGNIEVDTLNFHLSESGDPVSVEPQVFDLIVYLMTNRDRLVTRQEIFDKLWSGRIVSDTSLSNHIKSARKALGDDGQKQQVIKTVHGRGYQFIAHIEEVIEDKSSEKSDATKKPETEQSSDTDNSIAVLAFSDLSPEHDQEYFSDGLSEELINLLAKIPELRVISRTSSFSFKGTKTTTEEIGNQLNVTHILEGSVRKAGNRLRIT
ncbi:MAG: winged helix-turn-helix domain-containing protein, partial [Gammaproteobacteria bacterium]|nr:winged helix-turn-helix domain-containing protein [Gammaproteobacteria bacterium]